MGELAVFLRLCPNCRGSIGASRLSRGLPCERCLPEEPPAGGVCRELSSRGNLSGYGPYCRVMEGTREFAEFFSLRLGAEPWSLQLTWAKRVLAGRSFAILAPTGVGKTTFGLLMAAFLPARSYIIVPTKLLVKQVLDRLRRFTDKSVIGYTGARSERRGIEAGEFDILVTTHMFLYSNSDALADVFRRPYRDETHLVDFQNFIFIDDVDSFLKNSRNIDALLGLLGYNEAEIAAALEGKGPQVRRPPNGVVVISSATAQPRGRRVGLFRELLGFEVQRPTSYLRNVADLEEGVRDFGDAVRRAADFVRTFGPGAFVYVPLDRGKEGVRRVLGAMTARGVKAVPYWEFDLDAQDAFRRGEVWAAVGISHPQNPLVRGVDLPEAVRYAVFVGTPKMEIPTRTDPPVPGDLFRLLLALRPLLPEREKVDLFLDRLRKYVGMRGEELGKYPGLAVRFREVARYLEGKLADGNFLVTGSRSDDVSLVRKDGELFIVVGDVGSYLQASGRTSRLFAGGLTRGLSLLLHYDEKAFRSLKRRLRTHAEGVDFLPLEAADLGTLAAEIDADRDKVRALREGRAVGRKADILRTTLVIVESPNKARTIAGFFGRPQRRWLGRSVVYEVDLGNRLLSVTASLGHILDLAEGKGLYGVLEEDGHYIPLYAPVRRCTACGEQTTGELCPRCRRKPDEDKMETIESLRWLAAEVDEVFIATDPDAEGEKIAWDLYLSLRPFNESVKRIEFHEVTPGAFRRALEHPRDFSEPRVRAQMVRRIADRWVGFALSEHLQRRFGRSNLSAGRVQTPVLGWIIAREEERRRRKGLVVCELDGIELELEFDDPGEARRVFGELPRMRVEVLGEQIAEICPKPPFTTAELITAASEALRLPAEGVMSTAQELFEAGIITYHRTDSTRVSDAGMRVAREYISEHFGEDVLKLRSWGEGGAHECIRPTRPLAPDDLWVALAAGRFQLERPRQALALYRLIWARFIASQMREALVKKVTLGFSLGGFKEQREFVVGVVSPGFHLVSPIRVVELPLDKELRVRPKELLTVPGARPFTQGALIEEMKRRGLGRPSTYARIVSTLLERGYVVERGGFLFPTRNGRAIYDYLSRNFPRWTEEAFTRYIEGRMDAVESGIADHQEVLGELRLVIEEAED